MILSPFDPSRDDLVFISIFEAVAVHCIIFLFPGGIGQNLAGLMNQPEFVRITRFLIVGMIFGHKSFISTVYDLKLRSGDNWLSPAILY